MTCLVNKGKAVDIVYLDFRKAFDTDSHSILMEKLALHGLDESIFDWFKEMAVWLGPKSHGEWS